MPPPLSWTAAMKIIRIELELLSGVNMILFYEKDIRGGITKAICQYVNANNKFIYDYDE